MEGTELVKYGSELITDPGVQRFIGSVVDEPIERFADEVRYHRFKRQLKMWTRAKQLLEDAGLEAKPIGPVDLSVIVPLLESGSLQENEQLAEKWAALLAAAARGEDVHPSYPDILRQMTPMEVAFLDTIYRDQGEGLPRRHVIELVAERAGFPIPHGAGKAEAKERVNLAVDNLLRLSLVKRPDTWEGMAGQGHEVFLTSLGHRFVIACQPPG